MIVFLLEMDRQKKCRFVSIFIYSVAPMLYLKNIVFEFLSTIATLLKKSVALTSSNSH